MVKVEREQISDETHPHIHVHRSLRPDGSEEVDLVVDDEPEGSSPPPSARPRRRAPGAARPSPSAPVHPNAEDARHQVRRQHLAGTPSAATRPSSRTTTRGANAAARLRSWSTASTVRPRSRLQPPHGGQQRDLVGQIQVQGRLVEQEQVRLLGERHRHQHPLALAAGELVRVADPPGRGHRRRPGRANRALVVRGRAEEAPGVRRATHLHQLGDAEAVRQVELLGKHRHPARELVPTSNPRPAAPPPSTAPALGLERAAQEAQQGGLAAPVRAQQRHQLAAPTAQVHAAQDRQRSPPGARVREVDPTHPNDRGSATTRSRHERPPAARDCAAAARGRRAPR